MARVHALVRPPHGGDEQLVPVLQEGARSARPGGGGVLSGGNATRQSCGRSKERQGEEQGAGGEGGGDFLTLRHSTSPCTSRKSLTEGHGCLRRSPTSASTGKESVSRAAEPDRYTCSRMLARTQQLAFLREGAGPESSSAHPSNSFQFVQIHASTRRKDARARPSRSSNNKRVRGAVTCTCTDTPRSPRPGPGGTTAGCGAAGLAPRPGRCRCAR